MVEKNNYHYQLREDLENRPSDLEQHILLYKTLETGIEYLHKDVQNNVLNKDLFVEFIVYLNSRLANNNDPLYTNFFIFSIFFLN